MKTITWGSGGTYTGFVAAYAAITFDDDYILEQVGDSTESATLALRDQLGYAVIIKGNLQYTYTNTHIDGLFRFVNIKPTGDLTVEFLDADCVDVMDFDYSTTTSLSANTFQLRYCKFTTTSNDNPIRMARLEAGYSNIYIYGIDLTDDANPTSDNGLIRFPASSSWFNSGVTIHIEDCMLTGTADTDRFIYQSESSYSPTGTINVKRIYAKGLQSNRVFYLNNTGPIGGGTTETFCSMADSNVTATHDEIAFTTDNFLSIGESDPLFGVPKQGSVVYDDAVQTTNISDNIVGLNGIPVNYRAAGPYTPPVQINPPTGLTASYTGTGVLIEWTDYSPVQVGYEKVNVFYETVSVESAFTTAKATVNGGVEEYTIPYAELTASPVWYVRLSHGA